MVTFPLAFRTQGEYIFLVIFFADYFVIFGGYLGDIFMLIFIVFLHYIYLT